MEENVEAPQNNQNQEPSITEEATASAEPLASSSRTQNDLKDDARPGPSTQNLASLAEDLLLSDDSEADPHYIPTLSGDSSSTEIGCLTLPEETVLAETRKKGRSRIQRAQCKKLRNAGKSYVTEKGKTISERKLLPLKPCRMKCGERIKLEDREVCFQNYWNLGSRNKRASYIGALITIKNKKTQSLRADPQRNRSCSCSYEVIVNREKVSVCRSCFQSIFGETKGFVQLVLQKKYSSPSGIVSDDLRGLAPPRNKIKPDVL
nr:uncharacterized protein LOC106677622 [Halyomorpha halys]